MTQKFLQLVRKGEDSALPLRGLSIAISPSLQNFLHVDNELTLSLGQKIITVPIYIHSLNKQDIIFSKELQNEILLPDHVDTFLLPYPISNNILTLGPVIGILTEINEKQNEISIPSIHHFCEELDDELKKMGGFYYVCGLPNLQEDCVNGYLFHQQKWIQTLLPYPHVFYNRLHSRQIDASNAFLEWKKNFEARNIPLFNSKFFSKMEIHQLLNEHTPFHSHLPVTTELTELSLNEMLHLYSDLYLKPINGSQGRGIIHLQAIHDKYYTTLSSGKRKGNKKEFNSKKKLWKWLQNYMKKKPYLCQQGIVFQSWNERTLDFRILCHKNIHHNWEITSVVGRVAQEDTFVANLAQGAVMKPAKQILDDLFDVKEASTKLNLMKKLTIEIAEFLSYHTNGLLGELGIDVGIDKNGDIWIIEVNSKPSKKLDEHAGKTRPSTKALLEYFIALSFSPFIKERKEDA